ncbi:DoxX family protein [Flavobacterium sp. GT3R68]|uniref:DoxX family protein n=1 Tax=Flavobacterium sp. GT3R68 TaxID=2594437 RepID=UPI000F87308D|nr:DoxX family protein [Flavobacterium sp. GT3R68]RTY94904.1 DoxX family protein [Flavobacterium sp. GSN2]TRW91708.1 DoxX family protein [Flavobacterium sp. GT3R68]
MDTSVKGLNKWANAHTYYSLDILRVVLGVFLLIKGAAFITHSRDFEDIIAPFSNFLGGMFVFHYIASAHIMGGMLIAMGLLTRWCIIAQLPILIGAVAINFIGEMNAQNLILSVLALGVSIFFLFYGSGKHSVDYYFKMEK